MADTQTQVISVTDPQAISQVQTIMRDLWEGAFYEEYYLTFRDLEKAVNAHRRELETQYPLILQRYDALMNTARWNNLNRITVSEFETLFFQNPQGIADKELNEVLDALRYSLLQEPVREERDILKQRLRDALARSEVSLGQTKIQVADTLVDPTVKNWIKDWKVFVGDREPTSLLLVEYLNSSPNISQLPKDTVSLVQKIFRLYAELLKSSTTPEGAEEKFALMNIETGTLQMFDKGHLIESGLPVDTEELKALREDNGLDASGRPLPISVLLHRTDMFRQYARQVLAERGVDADAEPTTTQKKVLSNEDITKSQPAVQPVSEVKPRTLPTPEQTVSVASTWKNMMPRPTPVQKEQPKPMPTPSADQMSSKELAQYVLSEVGLLLPSHDLEERLLSVCTRYFDNRMTIEELREELAKVAELGGVGLTLANAQRILVVVQRLRKSDFAIPQVSVPMPKPRVKAPSLESLQKAMNITPSKPTEKTQQQVEDIFGNIDSVPAMGTAAWNTLPTTMRESSSVKRGPTAVKPASMPTLMGPLDELRAMTLDEFRRLSPRPEEAVKHIANQLSVLEEESVAQKAAGIQAWGQSPVNQLYLRIGRESLDRMMSIDDVIRAQNERKEPTLSIAEFQAIADFNRTLRF